MIIIHTYVTNHLYFLIINLYKVILYLYYARKCLHTSQFTQIRFYNNNNNNNNNNNAHNQYLTCTHTHII